MKTTALLLAAALAATLPAGAQSINPDIEPGAPGAKPAPGKIFATEVLDFVDPAFPSDILRQTIQETVDTFRGALHASNVPRETPLTLLPIVGDRSGYVASLVKSAITDAGRTFVIAENDPAWSAIPAAVEWSERKGDILDKDTLLSFGALQAARILLVAEVRVAQISDRGVLVEIDAHAVDARTARHLWGGVFSRRRYVGPEPPKPDDIPAEARKLLRGDLKAKTVASLRDCAPLAATRRIAVVPLFADVGGYATAIVKEALAEAGFTVVNLDVTSESEARSILRDKPADLADAFLTGVVRRLPETNTVETATGIRTDWTVEWSASVERASDHVQPWNATIEATGSTTEEFDLWQWICRHWQLVCCGVAFLAFVLILRAHTRVK